MIVNNNQLKEYENEVWMYNKKPIKLSNLKEYELEQCRKFLNDHPKGDLFGKKKYYWKEAIDYMIKHKSHKNINYIVKKQQEHKVLSLNNWVDRLTLNKIQTFKII